MSEVSTDRPVVDVSELQYSYPGMDVEAVKGISFSIEYGEIVGFLGPNGAGKSTTQNVVTGLLTGYEGNVRVIDREIREWDGTIYERIGVAPETPNHYLKLTGRENLELFASLYVTDTADPADLLADVGLLEAADRRVGGYSKGMKMRLSLVRALLHDPPLLFLDEPTAGMDPTTSRNVRELILNRQAAGTSIFLATHDMNVADALCDRVAFIVDGQLATIDTPTALKRAHGEPRVLVEYREDGELETAEFDLPDLGVDERFRTLLSTHPIERIHSEEATLEEVFIEVTGRALV